MPKMSSKFNNQKISQVINISSNYRNHRYLVENIKPAVDFSSSKRNCRIEQLSTEKARYTNAVRHFRIGELQKDNDKMIKRIGNTTSVYKGLANVQQKYIINPEQPRSRHNQSEQHQDREAHPLHKNNHNISRHSLKSSSSQKSLGSNFQRRTMRQKEIQRENKKMAQRIMKPKTIKALAIQELNKFFKKEQDYARIRSRFSERSQKIIASLALDGLKLNRRNVQFLPQLSFKNISPKSNSEVSYLNGKGPAGDPGTLKREKSCSKLSKSSKSRSKSILTEI